MALTLTVNDSPRLKKLAQQVFLNTVAKSPHCLGIVDTLPNAWAFEADTTVDFQSSTTGFWELVTFLGSAGFLSMLDHTSGPDWYHDCFYATLPTASFDENTSKIKVVFYYKIVTAEEYLAGTFDQ